ncbi:TPA: hypothetical protein ACNMTN_005615, partial [Klebsiella pneumoniae]
MNQPLIGFNLKNPSDLSLLKNLSSASARVSANKPKKELRDLGLVSILTSQTKGEKVEIELPSQDYLRLKKLQKTVRVTA